MSACVKKYLPLYVITLVVGRDDDDDTKTGEENCFQISSTKSEICQEWHFQMAFGGSIDIPIS